MEDFNYQLLTEYAENIVLTGLITLFVGLEIWLINRGASYLKRKLSAARLKTIKIQTLVLLGAAKLRLAIKGAISFLQVTLILLDIYFSLVLILSLFPGTTSLVTKLKDFIFVPLKSAFDSFIGYLPNFFTILVTVVVFRYVIKLVKSLAREIGNGNIRISGFQPYWAKTTSTIAIFILNALMLILILPYFPGYESLAFKGVAAFLGALVTLGGSSVIANYMAGIVIAYMNPCQIGDWIQIDTTTGEVVEISQFAIKLRTTKKVIVAIPNTKAIGSHIINYSGEHENHRTLLHTTISIGYDVAWKKVNELLISATKKTEGVDLSVEPFVRQIKLDDFYVVYELNVYATDVRQMYHIYSELHKHILDEFNDAEIEILSPHYRAQRDGNESTIQKETKT